MLRKTEELTPEVRALQLQVAALSASVQSQSALLDQQGQSVQSLLVAQLSQPATPVANLLWNGEFGHSVHTWSDVSDPPAIADTDRECAWMYSHNAPALAQSFTTITTNNQIPLPGHNFTTGTAIDLITTGTLPTGGAVPPALLTTYFVYVVSASVIGLATTIALAEAGTPDVTFTAGTGTGSQTIQQQLISTDGRTNTINNELKTYAHTTYNARYSRWNVAAGQGELTGITTLDAIIPSNLIDATVALARVSLIAAKKNEFIEITNNCLMYAGIWDNTSGQRKFLTGGIGFSATVQGAGGTVTRKYKILITSDRGFSILSEEVSIANAPSDAQFSSTNKIAMSWFRQAGQLQVEIYEYLPNGGNGISAVQYRLLTQISSANSYIHNGAFLPVTISGYPTSTQILRSATFFTQTGGMSDLATNNISATWDTVNFPIGVPSNYNKSNTTNRQWVRVGFTVAPNLFITGVVTNGTATITIPTGAIDSSALASGGYGTGSGSLYAGLVAQVYDSGDVLLSTTTISSVTSNTVLVLGASILTGTARKLRIVGGGFHGVLIDKIHLGYQQNTSYAINAFDIRSLQPLATPVSSAQGGVGGGGSGGGIMTHKSYDLFDDELYY